MILLFQDKLGITDGYTPAWNELVRGAGLDGILIRRLSVYNSEVAKHHQLLVKIGNRKAPGFNPDALPAVRQWFETHLNHFAPKVTIIMDPAMFGLFESDQKVATTDHLRGGVYPYTTAAGVKTVIVVMTPVSAINRRMDPKEIAALNQGAYSKTEWQELQDFRTHESEDIDEDGDAVPAGEAGDEESPSESPADSDEIAEEFFYTPYKIPYGRFVLRTDLNRVYRIYHNAAQGWLKFNYVLCDDPIASENAVKTLKTALIISEDVETNPLVRKKKGIKYIPFAHLTCIGFTGLLPDGTAWTFVFPLTNGKSAHSGLHPMAEFNMQCIKEINEIHTAQYTFQNGGYDCSYLCREGVPCCNWVWDSMTMFWSIWPELPKRLDFISSILSDTYQYWKHTAKSDDIQTYWRYNGLDCHQTLCNTLELMKILSTNQRARKNFVEAHARVTTTWAMSMRGMKADEERLAAHNKTLDEMRVAAEKRLKYLIGDDDFNVNSPKQKSALIYGLMGVKYRNAKGKFVKQIQDASTGAAVLRLAQDEHPLFRRVITAMLAVAEPSKQISNVVGITRREIRANESRFFTHYDGVGTTTSRLSSRGSPFYDGTNAQNLRGEYRDWLTADEGDILLDVDYSAADDVFVSFESGDPKKIELFHSGRDVHATNSALFFDNWTYDQVVAGKKAKDPRVIHPIRGVRQISKKVGHGCNYLMAGLTLLLTAGREAIVAAAKELGFRDAGTWSQGKLADFCGILESKYRNHYTRFRRSGGWYDDIREELVRDHGVTTAYGYYQRFLGNPRDDDVLRAAAATLGQANTAGRINDTLMELDAGFIRPHFRDAENPHRYHTPLITTRESHGVSLRLQSHDSLTFNISLKHPNWQDGCMRVMEVMSRPCVIKNKTTDRIETFVVRTEAELGIRWGKGMTTWDGTREMLEQTVIQAIATNTAGSKKALRVAS